MAHPGVSNTPKGVSETRMGVSMRIAGVRSRTCTSVYEIPQYVALAGFWHRRRIGDVYQSCPYGGVISDFLISYISRDLKIAISAGTREADEVQ